MGGEVINMPPTTIDYELSHFVSSGKRLDLRPKKQWRWRRHRIWSKSWWISTRPHWILTYLRLREREGEHWRGWQFLASLDLVSLVFIRFQNSKPKTTTWLALLGFWCRKSSIDHLLAQIESVLVQVALSLAVSSSY